MAYWKLVLINPLYLLHHSNTLPLWQPPICSFSITMDVFILSCFFSFLKSQIVRSKGIRLSVSAFFQSTSVSQSCPTLCDLMNHSTPGLPVHHQLLESTQTHVHRDSDAIQPSHPLSSFSSCLQSFPASGSFQMIQFFTSGGQSIGVSASVSVLPKNIQD